MLAAKALIAAVLLAGCSLLGTHPEKAGSSETDALAEAHGQWLGMLAEATDETGWPSTHDCDGTLWAGLAKAAGANLDLALAEYTPGEIHRRPAPCWTKEDGDIGSGSTVSRDMLTGYLWGLWVARDIPALTRLADYGAAHDWVMGSPADRVEVHMGGNLRGTLCRALEALTDGADARDCADEAPLYGPAVKDYERHLLILGVLLHGEVDTALYAKVELTGIDPVLRELLGYTARQEPADALGQAAVAVYSGDYEPAIRLILDPAYVCPTYVRGADTYCLVHKLFTASVILRHHGG